MGKALHSWRMQLSTAQPWCPTLDMLYKHCWPSCGDGKAFLASQMFSSSIQGPSHWEYLLPLYSKGNKWHLLPQVLLENYFIKNSTVKMILFYLVVLFRISRNNPFPYAMMAAVRDKKWLDMKLPSLNVVLLKAAFVGNEFDKTIFSLWAN